MNWNYESLVSLTELAMPICHLPVIIEMYVKKETGKVRICVARSCRYSSDTLQLHIYHVRHHSGTSPDQHVIRYDSIGFLCGMCRSCDGVLLCRNSSQFK